MPHAALWVVQPGMGAYQVPQQPVSMPHAALWVVQHDESDSTRKDFPGFNAARGFVGGAASSLAVLFPLGGKSSFGKSPEI